MHTAHEIIEALCYACSMFSREQIARGFGISERHAKGLTKALIGEGLLKQSIALAPPLLALEEPLFIWRTGMPAPEFGALSHKARIRWALGARQTKVFYATESAARLFGGRAISPSLCLQARHELHMSEVYLRFKQHRPEAIGHWVRGDVYRQATRTKTKRLPDAFIICDCGCDSIEQSIEFIAAYPAAQIASFHHTCKEKNYDYQVW